MLRLERHPFSRNGVPEWKVVREPGKRYGSEAFIAPGRIRAILHFIRRRGSIL